MSLPFPDETAAILDAVHRMSAEYLENLDQRDIRHQGAVGSGELFHERLPEEGEGAPETISLLYTQGFEALVHSAGPRFFHFVIGGATPAALGADWLTSVADQNAYAWVSSPLGSQLERLAIEWMADLFELPGSWSGVLTTGTTMANFAGLAAARQWAGQRRGVDVARDGIGDDPPLVLVGGHVHPSSLKALGMLGLGHARTEKHPADSTGDTDLQAVRHRLEHLGDRSAILIATAGEPNAGMFDPIAGMADLADEYDAWLHVDGAFGLFARVSPRTRHLAEGIERARSVAVDGHKWLNVPYDSGAVLVRDPQWLAQAFTHSAHYLPDPNDPQPNFGFIAPEMSRRARALPVWATLRAYGRSGYRRLVESCLDRALYLAELVDQASDLERLAEVPLNIVCFRYRPDAQTSEADLNSLNKRLGEALLEDGRVYAGTTTFNGKVALRPAIANWRTRPEDVELLVTIVREIGMRLPAGQQPDLGLPSIGFDLREQTN